MSDATSTARSVVALLERMAAAAEAAGDLAAAVALTRRQVALDPLSEEAHRELIRRLAANGDRSAALTTYRRLADRFASELGIVPSPATRELVEQIRAGETTPQPVAPPPSDSPPPAPPVPAPAAERTTGTVTLLFTDQVGSTETLQRLGDEEGERLRRAHFGLLREAAAMHGGEEVKNLGDGLMVAFVSAVDAVACAITIQQAVDRARASGELAFAVRIGLNVGEPIRDEGDYFGTPVVIAKRLCDAGAPGQILASEVVRALVGTRGGFTYRALGAVALKGVAEPGPRLRGDLGALDRAARPTAPAAGGRGPRHVRRPLRCGGGAGGSVGGGARARLPRRGGRGRAGDRQDAPGKGVRPHGARAAARRCWRAAATRRPSSPTSRSSRRCATTSPAALPPSWPCRSPRGARSSPRSCQSSRTRAPPSVPTGLGAEQERFRLFEAVSSLLADAAHLRPLVLFLDDLHWADQPSLLLLRHLARSAKGAPLMVLGTYRPVEVGDEHPLAEALAELRRARAVERLSLSGLGEAEVAELIAGRAGQQAPRGFVRRVADRSEGNPFFIEELLHDVGAEADWDVAAGGVPDSVRDLLLRRLRGLGDDCRQALSVAAVAGRDFELDVLERVLEHPRDRLIDLVEEAIDADVLVEPAQSVGRLSFSHALFRETIYEQLSATRKAAIHGRIAAAIEEAPTDRPDERAGTLAYHYRAAGELRKAFDYHRRAAAAAERVHAQETALENLEGAIVAGEMLGMTAATEETIRDLYRARAWTLHLLGEPERALTDLEHALEGARAAGDRATEMHVHNALGTHWHVLDPQASRRCHEEALRIAEELGDESGQVSALNRLSLVLANELEFAEAVELGERALEIARRAGDELAVSRAMDSLKFAALQLGDLERLEELCAELERAQRQRGDLWYLQWTLCESCYVPLERCDWQEAERRVAEALAISERIGGSQQRSADPRHVELDRALPRRLRTIARIRSRGGRTRGHARRRLARLGRGGSRDPPSGPARRRGGCRCPRARACRRRAQPCARADLPLPRSALFGHAAGGCRARCARPRGACGADRRAGHDAARQSRLLGRAGLLRDRRDPPRGRRRRARRGGNARSAASVGAQRSAAVDRNDRPFLGPLRRGSRRLGLGGADARPQRRGGRRGGADLRALADRSRACPRSRRGG